MTMKITEVSVKNWRNFRSVEFPLRERLFIVGPNASGKSNLLDVFRFVSDIASPGGGLNTAIEKRGGLKKVRSLFARNYNKGRMEIRFQVSDGDDHWTYTLAIRGEQGGKNRPIVDQEVVEHNSRVILRRPDDLDIDDPALLTQTHLEQVSANKEFRDLADYLAKVRYFHLVPQMIRNPGQQGLSSNDPYGTDFIAQMNTVPSKTRAAWLRRMQTALRAAVPEFESLEVTVDAAGRPHLEAGYRNWRNYAARQNESDFSDGTLRLIGLLWTLISSPKNGGCSCWRSQNCRSTPRLFVCCRLCCRLLSGTRKSKSSSALTHRNFSMKKESNPTRY
ncbi:MAG: AAA family ATPase [Propionibacteriaceae bacterium]|jgi:predicted ATPase|nr:AAA family ATPase [Propionibacteriaceae bacterium]